MVFVKLHPMVVTNSFSNLKSYLHSLMQTLENRDLAYKSMHITRLAPGCFLSRDLAHNRRNKKNFKEIDRNNLYFRKSQLRRRSRSRSPGTQKRSAIRSGENQTDRVESRSLILLKAGFHKRRSRSRSRNQKGRATRSSENQTDGVEAEH